jgi:hypothetical protein
MPEQARCKGEGHRNGMTSADIPDGYIDWDEHYAAWEGYVRGNPNGETAEQIEARGGFSYRELKRYLRRNPKTWRPQDPVRYRLFERAREDVEDIDRNPLPEFEPTRAHIFYAGSELPICRNANNVPEAPIVFEVSDNAHCSKCLVKVHRWIDWWTGGGI